MASLERLTQGVFDYAGLYPPARLELANAVHEYARHQIESRSLLGRFVCPASKVEELEAALQTQNAAFPTSLTAKLEEIDLLEKIVDADSVRRAEIEAFEIKTDGAISQSELMILARLGERFEVFVELPLRGDFLEALSDLAASDAVFAKARAGGLEAGDVPAPRGLAEFICGCASLELPFKLTAGLHHPFRLLNGGSAFPCHGFVNVLTAFAFAYHFDYSVREVKEQLEDVDEANWSFTDDSMLYHGQRLSIEEIGAARDFFRSIGTCSIDEPFRAIQRLASAKLQTTR